MSLLILVKVFVLTHPGWYMYFHLFVFSVVVNGTCLQDGQIPWRSNMLQPFNAALKMSTKIMGSPQGHMQIYCHQYSLFQFSIDQGKWPEGLYWWLVPTANICHSRGCVVHRPLLLPSSPLVLTVFWFCPLSSFCWISSPRGTSRLSLSILHHHYCQQTIANFPKCRSSDASLLFKCLVWFLWTAEWSPNS